MIIEDCIEVLSKMNIVEDPGSQMNELLDIFGHRRLIVDQLLKHDTISLNISQLIITIETLKNLQSESIIEVLDMPSHKWMNAA